MISQTAQLDQLITNVQLESSAQRVKYHSNDAASIKLLKLEGYLLQPVKITRKSYGYADYPEFNFQLLYPAETKAFKGGAAIQLICENEKPIKGTLINFEGHKGEVRIFAPDFPDWIEDKGLGIQLVPDQRTNDVMLEQVKGIYDSKKTGPLFDLFHGSEISTRTDHHEELELDNSNLNESQVNAINACLGDNVLDVLHGPPGTGKTTTLIELVSQLNKKGKRIAISAPSNTAVDHFGIQLKKSKIPFLRVGNNTKVNDAILDHTIQGLMESSKLTSKIKNLRIRGEQLRKMAQQYKRNFGKSERDQRKLLFNEVKLIRNEIRELQQAFEQSQYENHSIVIGTPIGLYDCNFDQDSFDVLIIDEAGQCLEPLAWTIIPLAKKYIFAGDPFQLPPTVISIEAEKNGLGISILERCIKHSGIVHFLDTQYRMQSDIAEYSNQYFYGGALKSFHQLTESETNVHYYDTVGANYNEERSETSNSIANPEEVKFIQTLIENLGIQASNCAVITPYSGQLQLAQSELKNVKRISTIDSFQGQEEQIIILSLVRSNEDQNIGFLKDYRRMNVALTRAKKSLYIIGDSATIGTDPFYAGLLEFIEKKEGYHSVWELAY